jgi:hypothetical protein
MNTVMILRVPQNTGNSLSVSAISGFSRKAQIRGVSHTIPAILTVNVVQRKVCVLVFKGSICHEDVWGRRFTSTS